MFRISSPAAPGQPVPSGGGGALNLVLAGDRLDLEGDRETPVGARDFLSPGPPSLGLELLVGAEGGGAQVIVDEQVLLGTCDEDVEHLTLGRVQRDFPR